MVKKSNLTKVKREIKIHDNNFHIEGKKVIIRKLQIFPASALKQRQYEHGILISALLFVITASIYIAFSDFLAILNFLSVMLALSLFFILNYHYILWIYMPKKDSEKCLGRISISGVYKLRANLIKANEINKNDRIGLIGFCLFLYFCLFGVVFYGFYIPNYIIIASSSLCILQLTEFILVRIFYQSNREVILWTR